MSNDALQRRIQRALDIVGDRDPHPSPMESRLPKIANDPELKAELAKNADLALWIREIELVDRALRVWPEPTLDDAAFDAMATRIEQRLDDELAALPDDPTEAPRFDDRDSGKTYDAVGGGLASLTAAAKAAGPPPVPVPNLAGPARAVVAPPPPPPPAPGATRQRGDPTLKGIAPPPPPPPSGKGAASKPSKPSAKQASTEASGPIERLSLSSMEEVRDSAERVSISEVGVEVKDDAGVVAIGTQIPSSEPPEALDRDPGERISFSTALRAPKLSTLEPPLAPLGSTPAPKDADERRPASEIPIASRKAAAEAATDKRESRRAPAPVVSLEAARDRLQTAPAPKEGRSMFWPTVAGVCALAAAAVIAITVQQRTASVGDVAMVDRTQAPAEQTSAVAPAAPALDVPPPPAAAAPQMVPTGTIGAVGPESPADEPARPGESPFNDGPGSAAHDPPPVVAETAPSVARPPVTSTAAPEGFAGVGGATVSDDRGVVARSRSGGQMVEAAGAEESDLDERRQAARASATRAVTTDRLAARDDLERAESVRESGSGGASQGSPSPARMRAPTPAPTSPPPPTPVAQAPVTPRPARTQVEEAPVDPATLPETLDRAAVVRGFAGVAAEVRGCSVDDRHGVAQVDVTISSSGRVIGAVVTGGQFAGTPIGSCIARAVRRARFPRFRNPTVRVSYPFTL